MENFFQNKNVLITGASSGLGLELAKQLIALRANVLGTRNNPDNIKVAVDSINSEKFRLIQCDVSDVEQSKTVFGNFTQVDILINNAGIYVEGKSIEIGPDKTNQTIQTNLIGAINSTNLILPKMLEQNSGIIYFVGSS